ncbi:MAG: ADP-glyceromanno-heptose 6-epimerase [Planctomycetota bacterium]|jgi:ADP-L-glycero-D-manno-heptose 6-epimerase|nr:ADP-glyceromanno-heptose 6-epimerase [Planctomycetota bacterium]
MYIVTGGAGFIGSAMVWKLNREGISDICIVDRLRKGPKWRNLPGLSFTDIVSPEEFLDRLDRSKGLPPTTQAVIHLGACSSTTEADADYLLQNNFQFSRELAEAALARKTRFLVASSAAVYGAGEQGYADHPDNFPRLRPLNMYGYSKLLFDSWAKQSGILDRLASLRFFNVYGPNEYHKGDMASMVFKAYGQIRKTGRIRLFKSYRDDFADGEQKRDFVYVKDVVEVMWWLLNHPEANGVFNIGSGVAESWNELAAAVFSAIEAPPSIEYVEMPASVRHQYQYLTQADMTALRQAGYQGEFRRLHDGVSDYINLHLDRSDPYINNGKRLPASPPDTPETPEAPKEAEAGAGEEKNA